MTKFGVSAIIVLLSALSVRAQCQWRSPEKGESTHWGGNIAEVQVVERPVKQPRGTVVDHNGAPTPRALVELWTGPDYLLRDGPQTPDEKSKQRRLKACRVGTDGKFCIRAKPGRYELRVSIDSGWNVTHAVVTVDPSGDNSELTIKMHLGT